MNASSSVVACAKQQVRELTAAETLGRLHSRRFIVKTLSDVQHGWRMHSHLLTSPSLVCCWPAVGSTLAAGPPGCSQGYLPKPQTDGRVCRHIQTPDLPVCHLGPPARSQGRWLTWLAAEVHICVCEPQAAETITSNSCDRWHLSVPLMSAICQGKFSPSSRA